MKGPIKTYVVVFIVWAGIVATIVYLDTRMQNVRKPAETLAETQVDAPTYEEDIDTWSIFVEALIWVESRGDETIVGANDDGGVLQLTPVYIAEANGILGRRGYYKVEDRFNREKSIEIFNVVNAYHNPERDFRTATRLHNPGAGIAYHEKVMQRYEELLKF